MLDNVNFIHMNGRVQDPVLGRFVSADPFISDPLDTQSYNRYSYVANNPLRYTDPSGFTRQLVCYKYFDTRSFLVPGGVTIPSSEDGAGGTFPGVGFGGWGVQCDYFDIPDPAETPYQTPNEPQTPGSNKPFAGYLPTAGQNKDDAKAMRDAIEKEMKEDRAERDARKAKGTWSESDEAMYEAKQAALKAELAKQGLSPSPENKDPGAGQPPVGDKPPGELPPLPEEKDEFDKPMKPDAS